MDQVKLRQLDTGVELRVKASPNSRQNDCRGVIDGALKISVTAVAEKGKANAAIIKFLSKQLGIPKGQIHLVSGGSDSNKRFFFEVDKSFPFLERVNELTKRKKKQSRPPSPRD